MGGSIILSQEYGWCQRATKLLAKHTCTWIWKKFYVRISSTNLEGNFSFCIVQRERVIPLFLEKEKKSV